MATLVTREGKSTGGVTLIELLVAIAIVGVVVATVVPSFLRALDGARFNAAAREILNALKTARHEALSERHETTVTFDTGDLEYRLSDQTQTLSAPRGASLMLITADSEQVDTDTGAIRFFSDGSSTGGTVTLSHSDRATRIQVDWLTGRVSFAD